MMAGFGVFSRLLAPAIKKEIARANFMPSVVCDSGLWDLCCLCGCYLVCVCAIVLNLGSLLVVAASVGRAITACVEHLLGSIRANNAYEMKAVG